MAEIEEIRKTVTKTNAATTGSSMTECAEITVNARSMEQVRLNVIGLRDFVGALNAAKAPQETHIDFSLEGALQYMTATWTKTETQTKKMPVYRQMNSDDGGGS